MENMTANGFLISSAQEIAIYGSVRRGKSSLARAGPGEGGAGGRSYGSRSHINIIARQLASSQNRGCCGCCGCCGRCGRCYRHTGWMCMRDTVCNALMRSFILWKERERERKELVLWSRALADRDWGVNFFCSSFQTVGPVSNLSIESGRNMSCRSMDA